MDQIELLSTGNVKPVVQAEGVALMGEVDSYGQNENGEWYRFEFGLQICTISGLTLPFFDANMLRGFWTYPQPFTSHVRVAPLIISASSGALFPAFGPIRQVLVDGTQTDLRIMKTAGGADFVSGNNAVLQATAIGRWK